MKSGFCSRGVHNFDGCERPRVPTKSGSAFFLVSARIDFSADGGLRIAEIENINSIEPVKLDSYVESELDPLLCKMGTTKKTTINLQFFRSKRCC